MVTVPPSRSTTNSPCPGSLALLREAKDPERNGWETTRPARTLRAPVPLNSSTVNEPVETEPASYPAVLKPGMVFTIEPGVYIPEEHLGVRIEGVFLVSLDGKLIDLIANLLHTADTPPTK